MTKVDEAREEILARLAVFMPELEGLRDYSRLNLEPATQEEVFAFIALYDKREYVLRGALAALDALLADGHPDLPIRAVSSAELADLQANLDTITAARARFISDPAVNIGLSVGETESK